MKKYLILFFVISLFILAGCNKQAPASEEPIKIGATLTLSGFGARWGNDAREGIALAIKEVNAEGGINGRPLQAIYEDFASMDLKLASTAAQKFTSVDKVDIIFTQWAEDNSVVGPIAIENNVLVMNLGSGSPDVPGSDPLVFMIRPTDTLPTKALIDYTLSQNIENPAMLVEQSAYFESLGTLANKQWKAQTGKDMERISVAGFETDYRSYFTKVKEGYHDAVFVYIQEDNTGLALKTAAELGVDILKIGFTGAGDPVVLDIARESAEGLVYPDFVPSEPFFVEKFKEEYGKEPEVVADMAYDAVKVIAKVMREHGTDTASIQAGLSTIEDFPGASGPITINEHGERSGKELVLKVIQDGKGVLIE